MLEIKLISHYLRKYLWLLVLIVIFQILIVFISIFSFYSKDREVESLPFTLINIIRNNDVIFLCLFLYPIIWKHLNENYFYKNHILKTKSGFRSNLIIVLYFFCICIPMVFIKEITLFSLQQSSIQKENFPNFHNFDYLVSSFADLHIIISSLLLGRLITFLPIKKLYMLYILLPVILLFLFGFFAFFGSISLFRLTPEQSTDIFSKQSLNAIYLIKRIMVYTPLAGYFVLIRASELGFYFKNILNFEEDKGRIIVTNTKAFELSYTLAIWIIVSLFVYITLIVLFSYLDKRKVVTFLNKINNMVSKWNRTKTG